MAGMAVEMFPRRPSLVVSARRGIAYGIAYASPGGVPGRFKGVTGLSFVRRNVRKYPRSTAEKSVQMLLQPNFDALLKHFRNAKMLHYVTLLSPGPCGAGVMRVPRACGLNVDLVPRR